MMTAPTILLQLIMTLAMWMPGVTPLMPNAALQAVEERYETDLAQRSVLIETMTGLESQHQNVITRITKLKQGKNTLTTGLALEDLLRQSKQLSEALADRPVATATSTSGQYYRGSGPDLGAPSSVQTEPPLFSGTTLTPPGHR